MLLFCFTSGFIEGRSFAMFKTSLIVVVFFFAKGFEQPQQSDKDVFHEERVGDELDLFMLLSITLPVSCLLHSR